MKRFLFILLLMFLPLQFSWAAAAPYCQHEDSKTARHFGHHVHKHAKADADHSHGKPLQADDDCAYCDLSCQPVLIMPAPLSLTVPGGMAFAELPPHFYRSPVPNGPKKPDRHLVA